VTPKRTSSPAHLPPPTCATVHEYAARLVDAGFWAPYVARALARHRLPMEAPEAGAVGTFPTFLVGRYVVKLFGELFFGAACHEVEGSLHRVLLAHPEIPAPALIADGELFDEGWPWPYLITARLAGTAWCDAALRPAEREDLARCLGSVVRRVHELPPPSGSVWERDWLAEFRAGCVDRHRGWGSLPAHLIDQIDQFLVEPSTDRRLIHADLHGGHLFVDRACLVGIVDWGDALVADRYYELPALHLRAFRGSKHLLKAFLGGCGWEIGADFARRAMTMTLVREFNVLDEVDAIVDLDAIATLDELADRLWDLP
jgi:hygromycin-B 7''-O-kinase